MGVCFYHHLSLLFKKYGLKLFCYLFEIKHTEFFYSCIFDLQCTKGLNNGINFYPSNLIRVKFKVNLFLGSLFIVAMEISIFFKDTLYTESINGRRAEKNWYWSMETSRFRIESFRVIRELVKITRVLKVFLLNLGSSFLSPSILRLLLELKMGQGPTTKGCVSGCKQTFELHRARTDGGSRFSSIMPENCKENNLVVPVFATIFGES